MYAAEFQIHCILCEMAQGGLARAVQNVTASLETLSTVSLHMQYSESACSVRTGYVFFGTLRLVIHVIYFIIHPHIIPSTQQEYITKECATLIYKAKDAVSSRNRVMVNIFKVK